jgi:hypothetical protein
MLREALFENPLVVAAGCVIWIPLAIWIVSLVHWMVMGDIEPITGVIGLGLAFGLGVASLVAELRAYNGFFLAAAIGTVALYPFLRQALDRREINKLDLETFEKAYAAAALRPDNIGARFKVAEIAFQRGYPGHAVKLVEGYMPNLDKRMFWEEHRLFSNWVKGGIPPAAFEPLACLGCGTATPVDRLHCPKCGAPVLLEHVRGRALNRGLAKKLLLAWMAMVATLAGLPVASALPGPAGIALVAILLAALVYAFWVAFRPAEGAPT